MVAEGSGFSASPGTQKFPPNNSLVLRGGVETIETGEEDYKKIFFSTNPKCPMPKNEQH